MGSHYNSRHQSRWEAPQKTARPRCCRIAVNGPCSPRAQPSVESIRVAFTQRLPPELHSITAESLVAEKDSTSTENLLNVRLTCKKRGNAVNAFLFEIVTIGFFSLTDQFAAKGQMWYPLRWRTPGELTGFLQSPNLRAQIRFLPLCV